MSQEKDLLVSIIIPVYKVEEYLDRCLESVVGQTYKNLEIILVDDGSPDNCPKMCDAWAKKDKRIKVIHKENGGVSSARNEGIKNATGDYLTFVDSDDFLSPAFSECIQGISNEKYLCFAYNLVDLDSTTQITPFSSMREKVLTDLNKIKVSSGVFNSVWNKFYLRRIIEKNNLKFDTSLVIAEDLKFNFDFYMCVQELTLVNVAYYNYFQNSTSVMKNINYDKIKNTLQVCEYLISKISLLQQKEKSLFLRKLISQNLLSVLYRAKSYSREQNKYLQTRLKQYKKYFCYGDNFAKKLVILFIKIFGVKFTAKVLGLFKQK